MYGLDALLAKAISDDIRKNLGEKTIQKIENRLLEKYDSTLTESIESFSKLDSVLREFFGNEAESIERQIVEHACIIEKSKESKSNWIKLEDPIITQVILKSFGDADKRKILESLIGKSKIISEVIENNNIPQTSAYRKFGSLINNGLLIADETVFREGKIIQKYTSLFENLRINILGSKIIISVQVSKKALENCSILQTVYNS